MPGTHPYKLELRCLVEGCGILCYQDRFTGWTHEYEPAEPHDPKVPNLGV